LACLTGVLCAVANGAALPLYTILLGDLFDALAQSTNILEKTLPYAFKLVILGIVALVTSTGQEYLRSVLNQDISWWDTQVIVAIGAAVPSCIQHGCRFVTGIIIGFVYGWQLALIILAIVPLLFVVIGVICAVHSDEESTDFRKAAIILEESFTYIRTVAAFNAQKKELDRFDKKLKEVQIAGEKKAKTAFSLACSCS
jgi:ABC-type multidrug transport system fused ATPase/permease subunit